MSVPSPRQPLHDEPEGPSWCAAAVPPQEQRADVLAEIYRWSTEAMTADPDIPPFGSSSWCALPDGSAKTYAAVRAALAWWTEQWARADAYADAHVDASHAVSGAEDWHRVARDLLQRSSRRIPRRD